MDHCCTQKYVWRYTCTLQVYLDEFGSSQGDKVLKVYGVKDHKNATGLHGFRFLLEERKQLTRSTRMAIAYPITIHMN